MEENKIRMSIVRHNALHSLFGMLHTPHEQIKECYYLYETVLSATAKELFSELIGLGEKGFYIDGMVRNGKRK